MPMITFASSKGGAGKTTAAIVLGTTLARRFKNVVLIDADPARRLMSWAGKEPLPERLKVQPAQGESFIQAELRAAAKIFDFVIVDLESAATRLNSLVMSVSDLVIIPMGDNQEDAEAAIETVAQVNLESRLAHREIPARILFARTQTGVKSRLARSLNAQVRDRVGAFGMELYTRTAIASLHEQGGTLYDMNREEISGVPQAIANVELFVDELNQILEGIQDDQRKAKNAQRRRDANPTVQMSVRMLEETYEQFRALCQRERRTNGEMLAVLMESYSKAGGL